MLGYRGQKFLEFSKSGFQKQRNHFVSNHVVENFKHQQEPESLFNSFKTTNMCTLRSGGVTDSVCDLMIHSHGIM